MDNSSKKEVSRRIIRGVGWNVALAVGNKLVTFLGQIVLAWLLLPTDFGVAAIGLAILQLSNTFSAGTYKTFLIQSANNLSESTNPVFWLGVMTHLALGVIVFAASRSIATFYESDTVYEVLQVVSLCVFLNGLSPVFFAKLQATMRFDVVAKINLAEGFIQTLGAIILAYLGMGALSLIIPRILSISVSAFFSFKLSGVRRVGSLAIVNAIRVLPKMWPLLVFAVLNALVQQAPFLVLGRVFHENVVGLFFWGSQLATQAVFMLSINLREVFFPAFTVLQPDRSASQTLFVRASVFLSVALVGVCVLQWVYADAFITRLFGSEWASAVSVVEWMSLCLVFTPLNTISISLLIARRSMRSLNTVLFLQIVFIVTSILTLNHEASLDDIAMAIGFAVAAGHLLAGAFAMRAIHLKEWCILYIAAIPASMAFVMIWAATLILKATNFSGLTQGLMLAGVGVLMLWVLMSAFTIWATRIVMNRESFR